MNLFLKTVYSFLHRWMRLRGFLRSWYWRGFLKSKGFAVSDDLCVKENAFFSVSSNAKLTIGSGVILGAGAAVYLGEGGRLDIESGVFIGRGSTVACNEKVRIGKGTQIAHYVTIIDTDHKFGDPKAALIDQGQVTAPIEIGSEVWIGAHSIVLKGCHLGTRSVVGAGSVVTKSVPDHVIVVGSPAKPPKSREGASPPNER